MENKKEFVEEFGRLLCKHRVENIVRLEYVKDDSGERVIIYTHDPIFDIEFTEEVSVNMDSLAAIIRDVMKVFQ